MAYSMLGEEVFLSKTPTISFVDSGGTTRNGQTALTASTLQSIAESLGDDFSADTMNMNGFKIACANNGVPTATNQYVCGEDYSLPCLKYSKMPNVRIVFYCATGDNLWYVWAWVYDVRNSPLPVTTSLLSWTGSSNISSISCYSINQNVHAIGQTVTGITGGLVFYDDFIICTNGSNFYDHTGGNSFGWTFLDSDGQCSYNNNANTSGVPTSTVYSVEKLFCFAHLDKNFAGLYSLTRAVNKDYRIIIKNNIYYTIFGSEAARERSILVLSSEILGS